MDVVLLTLVLPVALEDAVLELLLEHPATESFSSSPARGHGAHESRLSVSEQVAGWRREVRIEVLVAAEQEAALRESLGARLPTPEVRYWTLPVSAAGSFGDPASEP
jgi:hypothetical protein